MQSKGQVVNIHVAAGKDDPNAMAGNFCTMFKQHRQGHRTRGFDDDFHPGPDEFHRLQDGILAGKVNIGHPFLDDPEVQFPQRGEQSVCEGVRIE